MLSKAFPSASKSLAEQVPPRPLDGKFLWAVAGAVNANAVGSARQSATAADAPLSFDHISSIGRYENAESLRRVLYKASAEGVPVIASSDVALGQVLTLFRFYLPYVC